VYRDTGGGSGRTKSGPTAQPKKQKKENTHITTNANLATVMAAAEYFKSRRPTLCL
jgi:hypothetical protein